MRKLRRSSNTQAALGKACSQYVIQCTRAQHDMLAQLCTRRTCDSKGPVLLQASAGGGRLVSSNAGHVRPCDACSHSIAPGALTAPQRPFEASVQQAAQQCVPVDIEALPTHARCERKIAPAHRVGHVGRAGDSLPFGMHLRLLDEDPGRLKGSLLILSSFPYPLTRACLAGSLSTKRRQCR